MTRPYILAETHWKAVKDTDFEVAILPWGATEAHNYHMPYATDNIQCDHIAAEAARLAWQAGAKIIVLPTVPFGVNTGQLDVKLDINMNPSTQMAVLRDITDALQRQRVPKLLVLNGHGGNDFRQMARELQVQFPRVFLCVTDWYKILNGSDYFEDQGDHAGELETSLMLHLAPELVLPLDQAGEGKANSFRLQALREGWVWAQRSWTEVSEDTGIGNPSKASEAKGRRFFKDLSIKLADFLIALAKTDNSDLYQKAGQ
jgi:creatinine amidohydrolase